MHPTSEVRRLGVPGPSVLPPWSLFPTSVPWWPFHPRASLLVHLGLPVLWESIVEPTLSFVISATGIESAALLRVICLPAVWVSSEPFSAVQKLPVVF